MRRKRLTEFAPHRGSDIEEGSPLNWNHRRPGFESNFIVIQGAGGWNNDNRRCHRWHKNENSRFQWSKWLLIHNHPYILIYFSSCFHTSSHYARELVIIRFDWSYHITNSMTLNHFSLSSYELLILVLIWGYLFTYILIKRDEYFFSVLGKKTIVMYLFLSGSSIEPDVFMAYCRRSIE